MPKLTINGQEIEVASGTSVLQACEQLGIEIPRFCYHNKLSIAGSCRMCLVEIEKAPKLAASCAMPCAEGMVVHTDTDAVKKARQSVMEMLLLNHPLDCPVCDQGGECDLQDIAFAYGRDHGRTVESRRQVRDKELGPLIKTVMNRCIHCTRCVRFMDEIAGTPELGSFFRGEKMEIAGIHEGPLLSELSGNLVDVCPVGALTSKPYAFRARPWELKKTDSIDVMDAVGSNIRIDTRGGEVMRIVPRVNEAVNEAWINDKTRFACDGLNLQRIDQPYLRREGHLRPASWDEALEAIAVRMKNVAPARLAALAGDLVDCESLFALSQLMHKLDCPNMDCRQDGALYDVATRCSYVMNTPLENIEKADAILLIGTNPRLEATLVNARIYKNWRRGGCAIGLIGAEVDLGYEYEQVGYSPVVIRDLLEGKKPFAQTLAQAKNPMVIIGAGALARDDGAALQGFVRDLAEKTGMVREDWNGFNVLQIAASRVGGLDLGFLPAHLGKGTTAILEAAQKDDLDVLYLLGADEIDIEKPKNTFIIYQGHHGDKGAQLADVILPSCAYTEKDGIYVNVEGRPQLARRAVPPPEQAREDWKIINAIAQSIGRDLSYPTIDFLRAKMFARCPWLAQIGEITPAPWEPFAQIGTLSLTPLKPVIDNFYMTDSISRASLTMAKCTAEILPLWYGEGKK